jgi:hypothetical protein
VHPIGTVYRHLTLLRFTSPALMLSVEISQIGGGGVKISPRHLAAPGMRVQEVQEFGVIGYHSDWEFREMYFSVKNISTLKKMEFYS